MSDQLSVALIDEHLKDLVYWERLALHLEDIVYADIEIIKRENPLVASQRLALFDKWLRKCSKPTWDKLALALEKVDENRLAQQLRKYLQIELVQEGKGAGTAAVGSQQPTIVSVDEGLAQKLVKLQEAFSSIVIELKISLKQLVESKKTELSVMVMVMKEAKAYRFTGLDDVEDIDSFFQVILPHYHFLNCHLLLILAKRFLNPSEVLEGLYQHQKNISVLKRDIKIKQLKQVLESFVSKLPHESPVTVKVQDAWDESELHVVEVLLQTMFRLPHSDVLKIFRVVPGSVIIVYLVPHHITESLITHSQHKTEFMRLTGIISLQVGETYVLREDNSKEGAQEEYSFEVALMEAIGLGNREAVTFLLEHVHADVNTQAQLGSHNHELLKSKFGFLSSYISTLTPLVIAYYSRNPDMIQLLLQHNANPDIPFDDDGVTVLYSASENDDLVAVNLLLTAGNADPDLQKKNGVTPLFIASQDGCLEIIEKLLQAKANPDISRNDGVTPLFIASQEGHLEVVECLLKAKADPNAHKENGTTPLYIASEQGHSKVVERLLKAKVNPDVQNENGTTPLYIASQEGHSKVVERLLKAKVNPDIAKENQVTSLLIASQNGHLKTVEMLLQFKANPNIPRRSDGLTPLYIASQEGYLEIVEALLFSNAIPNIPDDNGATPLHIASKSGHLAVVDLLLSANANPEFPTDAGITPLYFASGHGHLEVVKKLLQWKVIVNTPTCNGSTPLYIACQNGHSEVVKALLQANAVADIPNDTGLTPLFVASQEGHYEIVEELLQAKANPDVSNHLGETPLFIACKNGHVEVIKRLLQANADLNSPSLEGVTPLMIANHNGHSKVSKLIEHHVVSSFNDQKNSSMNY